MRLHGCGSALVPPFTSRTTELAVEGNGGNLAGGFAHYRASQAGCIAMISETFETLDLAPFSGVSHLPHREDPDRAADAIADFFLQ